MKSRANDTANKGQALLELAVVLPLLVLLLLGVFDFARAIRANNTISNMSREGANLASRSSIAPQDIMDTLAATAQPLTMQNNGMIYITTVQGVAGGSPQIQTQAGWQNSSLKNIISSRIGTPTAGNPNPTALNLDALNLAAGQTAYVVEVFYNFQSLFSSNLAKLGSQFYSRTIF
jgi:Flp pilus assembly protein TadG